MEASQAKGREGHQHADRRGRDERHDDAEQRPVGADHLHRDERPEAGEGELGERDLSGIPRERHVGEHDDGDRHGETEVAEVGAAEHRGDQAHPDDQQRSGDEPLSHRGARDLAEALGAGRHPDPLLGKDDQHDEQQDDRERALEVAVPGRDVAHVCSTEIEVAPADPEDDRPDEGHGQALEPADHRRGVGVDHEQGERALVEVPEGRGDQDAGESCQERTEHPRAHRGDRRVATVQARQVGVVDHGSHGDTEPSASSARCAGRGRRAPRRSG